ncbi:MAG: hypothetical protein HOV81_33495 [Kofleriaceae bacterium]|nr:hypothetical protein [Kofleriaceae bacterium]
MRIRNSEGDWTFDRQHAFHVLGLDGTGALRRRRIHGVVEIERGGVWLHASRQVKHTHRRRR